MKSKTKIRKQLTRKTSPNIVKTIKAARKAKAWYRVAEVLSGPRRKRINVNLSEIDKSVKDADKIIVIPGKILSQGDITCKVRIVAFSFSERAKEKLLKAGCEIVSILDEIKKNPDAKGIRIIGKENNKKSNKKCDKK